MKAILNNGVEVTPNIIIGEKVYFQNTRRDMLKFVFENIGLDEADTLFTADNCEKIVSIGDDGTEQIHHGYVVRVGIEKTVEEKDQATATEEAVYVEKVTVKMAERTYAETMLANLTETVDVLVLESLMA